MQTVRLHRRPLATLERAQSRYGDVFALRRTSGPPLVVCASPEAAASLGPADPGRARAGAARRSVLPQAHPSSLFGSDGPQHERSRAEFGPAFTRERLDGLRPVLGAVTDEHLATWPTGRPTRVLQHLRPLVLDLFVRTVLGVEDRARATRLVAAVGAALRTPGNPPVAVPGPTDGLTGRAVAHVVRRRRARVRTVLEELLDGPPPEDRDAMLARVLRRRPRPDADALTDELLVVLGAAQEPPAIALAWVLHDLARRPQDADRMRRDPRGDALHAFAAETLQRRPPAFAALRTLEEPVTLGGVRVPAGAVTAVPLQLVQRGRDAVRMPFGQGARACIARELAWVELEVVLPAVLERFALRAAWPREERAVLRATTLVPNRSGLLRLD